MRTGPTNEELKRLIEELRKKAYADNTLIWRRIADDLSKPTRQRRTINLSRINLYTKQDETVIVPGKVLSSGELDHSLTIAAWKFSEQAKQKIEKANSKAISIVEIMKENIKGKRIKIIG